MKRSWVLGVFIVVAMLTSFALAGTISGKIVDEDAFSLAGANVYIEELGIGSASNQNGEFIILNVPTGTYKLNVTYIGYETKTVDATVNSGKTTVLNIELKSGVIFGSEVLILGDRLKGQAKALQQQKTNANISNVVSSDQMGRFPDANIGDALKRIPAISVNYDQGEARFVNIRGTEARLNSVMINGDRVPSAEGEVRAVQVDLIPSDMIQTIEVNKAITADMDADAIGGAINLITRQAPNELRVSGTLGSGYNFLSGKPQVIGSAVLGKRFIDNKLGAVLSLSYFDNQLGSHNTEGEWDEADDGTIIAKEWDVRTYEVRRLRKSISANFDYEINENHKLALNTMYNHRNDWENRFRLRIKDLDEEYEDGVSNDTEWRIQTKGGSSDNDNARLEDQRTGAFTLKGDHLFNDIKLDWSAGYALASEERPNERYISWKAKKIDVTQDLSDLDEPHFIPLNSSDVDYENFELKEITEEYQWTEEKDIKAKMNLEIPLIKEGKFSNAIKAGLKYKQKEKERDNEFCEYVPTGGENDGDSHPALGGSWNAEDEEFELSLADQKLVDKTEDDFLAGDYKAGKYVDPEFLADLDLKNSSQFEEEDKPEEYAADNYEATEKVTAAYLMLKQNLDYNLSVNVGLRVEQTAIEYDGNQYDENDETVKPTSGESDYTNILPSLHVKYNYDKNTIIRAAWTNTIARPNYYDLVPYRNISEDYEELEIGNPDLKPTTSMNFDLMGERYFSSIGLLSAGVFYKKLNDFIYVEKLEDYKEGDHVYEDFYQPKNGAEATLYGFEVAYQQQLTFLPGLLKNFGVYMNYTYTYSEADNPQFREDADTDETIDLPGTAPHTLNAALSYQQGPVILGLAYKYTAPYLDGDSMDLTPGLERYYDQVNYLDFNGSLKITDQLRFFLEANNLLNQPLRYYAGDSDRTYQAEYYDRRISLGLKFDM